MNSLPSYREFALHGLPALSSGGGTARRGRGLLRRVLDAIEHSHQRAAERDIARVLGSRLSRSGGQLTDEIERSMFEHVAGNHGFRP
jgi:hypothetical protein